MQFEKEFMGKDFTWFIGEVEDRDDPLFLGRVRVRCFGWHTLDKSLIPTDKLPWANTVQPVTAPATVSSGLKPGTWVFGFFMDGDRAQKPMVMGLIPGYTFNSPGQSDVPTAGRFEADYPDANVEKRKADQTTGIVIDPATGETWDEPADPEDSEYPTTQVIQAESGPYTIYNTTGRYATYTPSGSYMEIQAGGDGTYKIVTDKYTLVGGSDFMDVGGTVNMTVGGDVNWNIGGDWTVNVGGNVKHTVGGNVDETYGGNQTTAAGGNVKVTGAKIDLN